MAFRVRHLCTARGPKIGVSERCSQDKSKSTSRGGTLPLLERGLSLDASGLSLLPRLEVQIYAPLPLHVKLLFQWLEEALWSAP
jgi:hypothetical protein